MSIIRLFICLGVFLCCAQNTAFAVDESVYHQTVLTNVLSYSKSQEPEKAKTHLTARSHDLYDRIYAHNLTFLLPQGIEASQSQTKNGFDYVRFIEPNASKKQSMIMTFQEEGKSKKLDLPETFRVGFGEEWPKTLDMVEQAYVFMRQQYGEEQSVEMLKTLTRAKK